MPAPILLHEPLSPADRQQALALIERAAESRGSRAIALVVAYLRTVNQGLAAAIDVLRGRHGLTDDERSDLDVVLFGYLAVAKRGCGLEGCPPDTCSERRRARVLLKALGVEVPL